MTNAVGFHVVGSIYPPGCVKPDPKVPSFLFGCELYSDTLFVSHCRVHKLEAIAVREPRIACYHCIASVPISYSSFADRVVMTYLRLRSWPSGLSSPLSR